MTRKGHEKSMRQVLRGTIEGNRNAAVSARLHGFLLILGLLLVWEALSGFGLDDPMKRFVTMYAATWPILINTLYGVRGVDPILIDSARTFRFSAARRALTVVVPAASPQIATGLRLDAGIALILVVTTEMVASRNGLGYLVAQAQLSYRIPAMYAGILSIAVLGYVVNLAFVAVESRALGWHRRMTSRK